jgi:hypothetical protein
MEVNVNLAVVFSAMNFGTECERGETLGNREK